MPPSLANRMKPGQCMGQANWNNSKSTWSSKTNVSSYQSICQAPYLPAQLDGACIRSRQSSAQTPHGLQASYEAKVLARLIQIKMKSAGLCKLVSSLILLLFRCRPAGGSGWKVSCSWGHVCRDVAASVTLEARHASAEDFDSGCWVEGIRAKWNTEEQRDKSWKRVTFPLEKLLL
jgi:hypothetical protein